MDVGKVLDELLPELSISWRDEADPDYVTVSFTGTDESIMQFCLFLKDAIERNNDELRGRSSSD
jgi:hypothetical protein